MTTTRETVQLIQPYEAPQFLVQPLGDPEDAGEWWDVIEESQVLVRLADDDVLGWAPYAGIVAVDATDPYAPPNFYLVPQSTVDAMHAEELEG